MVRLMNQIQGRVAIQSNLDRWTEDEKKARVALVDQRDEGELLSLLHLYVKNCETTPTGAVKLQIGFHTTPNLVIFENTQAVVDGSIRVLLKQNGVVAGTATCALPYKGAESQGHMECICRGLSQKAESFDIEFEPNHLWLVESNKVCILDTWSEATAKEFISNTDRLDEIVYGYVAAAEKITVNEILDLMIAQHAFLQKKSREQQLNAYRTSLQRQAEAGRIEKFMENSTYYYRAI